MALTSKEIRQTFIDFFKSKSHHIVDSAPMVVKNDPTLMFTNAGMNQFKDIFLGNQPAKYSRIADTQKCLRVSGKHNDLEEVGHDTYHHTMFEMLGNWSFGDYFKTEAINWAWELLVDVFKLPQDRLYATIFEGYKADGVARDDEAYNLWLKHLPAQHIIEGNKKDNFWEMGDTGPCGPCSEIHIDLRSDSEREKIPGHELVNKDHPQVIEIWNLVFMQFNRKANGKLEELPARHVDTGMGFERLCMALQGKHSNYDTDVFQNTIGVIGKLSGKKYGDDPKQDIAMRVIADHLRAITFAIADGQLPSNNKAGYVIRRILRRAVRYGYTFLGFREAFIYKLVPVLKEQMGGTFAELISQEQLIVKVIQEEENSFLRTLETGLKLLDGLMEKATDKQISGKDGFTLYDTFGFPLDLTELILRENGFTLDREAFDEEMARQKDRSRNAAAQEAGDWVVVSSEDDGKFIGYDNLESNIRITRYRTVKTQKKEIFHLVFNETPFYAESGGEVGDRGFIESENEKITILDTQKENNLIIHIADKLPANPKAAFKASVPANDRRLVANNHSATHLLDYALRQVLGSHVEQKGSLVNTDGLRFDFSHFQKVTDEELLKVQHIVNQLIRQNIPLQEYRNIPIDDARKLGAIALFGEKYGETVRVIKFGDSIEFCGGIHAQSTGQIGMFRIVSESAISAGVRRIEAITADKVESQFDDAMSTMKQLRLMLNNPSDIAVAVRELLDKNSQLNKQLEEVARKEAMGIKDSLKASLKNIGGVNVIAQSIAMPNTQLLKELAFKLKDEVENLFLVLGANVDGKPNLTVVISEQLAKEKGWNAGAIVREAAKAMQGGGGGQPFYATAGGKDLNGLEKAIEIACKVVG